jgi:glucose/mannose transport system permease protein
VTLVAFVGAVGWTVYLSFTNSKRFPDYALVGWKQYFRLFGDELWVRSLENMVVLGLGSLASIIFGFVLAALINKEIRGEGVFRTVFLYPLAVSLIVTGIVWRWLFNPSAGIENFFHSIGWDWLRFNWLASPQTVMNGIILASVWQSTGFFMALMLAGLKGINPEIWKAAKLDGVSFWRVYLEIIIPMMKLTFLTCVILLSIGVVKAYDIVVAMTNGGPGGSSFVPAYFAINAYWQKENLGYASAAATIMLAITALLFSPFLLSVLFRRRNPT